MGQPRANEDSEATMLARVFLLGLLDGTDQRREVLLALRRRAVSDLEELKDLGDTLTDRRDEPGESPYPRAALHYGLRTSEGAVAWLEELLDGLAAVVPAAGRAASIR